MNREEFLRQFREALEGKVSERIISENVTYYRNYINQQINSGKSEEEVLRELGDPRLLAKTIEESSRFTKGTDGRQKTYNGSTGYGQEHYQSADYKQNRYGDCENTVQRKVTTVPLWLVVLIGLLIVGLILVAAFHIFVFFLPLILAGAVAMIVYRALKSIFH
ncbi:MAG: DUF1700 domain-containing protein [Lachnospiraceae bacterium]|nr:DUF1700 domain-containing protein [Lachnospiraceae bacterium]